MPVPVVNITHASWYGGKFFGRRLACGGHYSPNAVFVAHRTYPCGTKLLVTNLVNHESIVVIVKDRGPYLRRRPRRPERDLDLSFVAAEKIHMTLHGVVLVSYSKIPTPPPEDISFR